MNWPFSKQYWKMGSQKGSSGYRLFCLFFSQSFFPRKEILFMIGCVSTSFDYVGTTTHHTYGWPRWSRWNERNVCGCILWIAGTKIVFWIVLLLQYKCIYSSKEIMNFTSEVRMSPDGQYGSIQSDGTWNGMVRELQLQNADIGDKQSYPNWWLKSNVFKSCFSCRPVYGYEGTKWSCDFCSAHYWNLPLPIHQESWR